jgi:hypothetical protein
VFKLEFGNNHIVKEAGDRFMVLERRREERWRESYDKRILIAKF